MAHAIDTGRKQGTQVVFKHSHINPEYAAYETHEHVFNFKSRNNLQPAFIPHPDLDMAQVISQFEAMKQS